MYIFDKIDKLIVDVLLEDGRKPSSEIARLISVSERSVRYRMDRLIEKGIINISAVVNPKTLGFSVVADIFIEVEPRSIFETAKKIAGFEQVTYVACSIGDRDISVQIVSHDTDELYNFVTEVISKIPGVRKTTTSIVPLIIKDVYKWHIPTTSMENPTNKKPSRKNKENVNNHA